MINYFTNLISFFKKSLPELEGVDADSEIAGRIRANQVSALTSVTPLMMTANIVNAVVIFIFVNYQKYPHFLSIWVTLLLVVAGLGMLQWYKNKKRKVHTVSKRAQRKFLQSAFIFGLLWGAIPMVLYSQVEAGSQVLIVAVTGGMMGGGAMSLYTIPKAMLVWLTAIAGGCAIGFFISGNWSDFGILILLGSYMLMLMHAGKALALNYLANLMITFKLEEKNETISVLLKDFSENTSDWLWQCDENGVLLHGQKGFEDHLGTVPQCFCVLGQPAKNVFIKIKGANAIKKNWLNREAFRDTHVSSLINGKTRWVSVSGKPLVDLKGNFIGFRGVAADITENKQAEERIAYLAHNDALTGLVNRIHFSRAIANQLKEPKTTSLWSIMFLDLDGFKLVNDSKGHAAGDKLLEMVAARFKRLCSSHDVIARLGGDEFAILNRSSRSVQALTAFSEKLIFAMNQPFDLGNDQSISGVSLSIGIAIGGQDGSTEETLLHNADLALYRAKREGKGTHRFFELQMDELVRERRLLEQDLREALGKDQLSISFQPLVSADTKTTEGFEALVRWDHPTRGVISPADFIPIAESMGLINDIGHRVLLEACSYAANWPAHLFVSVNLSPQQFLGNKIIDSVKQALEKSGLDAPRLELEVTEGVLIENTETVTKTLNDLKQLGVSIALDDFGTGYSSLSYLLKFPFDKLKVDRSFILAIEEDDMAKNVFEAIVKLGNILELKITAEGVETQKQVDILEAYNCTHLQGFLFGKPLPSDEMAAFLIKELGVVTQGDFKRETKKQINAKPR